jgi:uncharacterized repeat protein (TIGR01451 family)
MTRNKLFALFVFALSWLAGAGSALAQTVDTSTTLGSSANPGCFGRSLTFMVTVTANPTDSGTPSGTVVFKDGSTVLDTQILDDTGQASLSTSALVAGSHSISAEYSGDTLFNGSISLPLIETINTSPVLNANPADQAVCTGNAVTFNASASGSPSPVLQWQLSTDGGVNFNDIIGATNPTYGLTVSLSDNGKQYRARFTNTCATVFSTAATLSVSARPAATVSGSTTICAGSSTTIQAALTGAAPWTVVWSDGVTNSNVSNNPLSRSVSPLTNRTYTVTSISDANCAGTASGNALVTVNPLPFVTANPSDRIVCAGGSASFTASASGTPIPSIQWQASADGGATFTNISGATGAAYAFTVSLGDNSKQYRAQFSNTCGLVNSTAAILTVNALPGCSIAGADGLCANSTNNLYSGPAGLTAYRWSITGNGTITGATNAQTISVNAGASGTFTLTLTLTNASGCNSSCTKTVANFLLPTAVVSGGGSICPGASTNIQAALTGTGPWAVVWSDGFTQSGVASSPATRSVSPISTTIYSVTTISDVNCSRVGTGSVTVKVNSSPAVTGNPANNAVCAGSPVSFSASASGIPTPGIQWQVSTDGGVTFSGINGATGSTYTFTASPGDNGKLYRAQFSNTCGVANSTSASLTVNDLPACSISGADALCASSVNNAFSGPGGLAAYRWSITGSGTINGTANAQVVSINAGASGTFTLTLTLTNASGCTSACTKTVTNLPLPTATVGGGGAICPGNTTNIQAILTGTGPWRVTWSDGVTQSNVVASPAIRTVNPSTTTTYSVITVTDVNCANSGTGSAVVTLNSAPVVNANPSNKTVCAGSSVSFTAGANGTPAPVVQWQVSADGGATFTNLAGATSSTYTFTASLGDNLKRYRALFTNACGSALSGAASLTVNALPVATITTPPIVCANSTGNIASVASAGAGAGYAWTVSGGTITSGAGTSSITYTAGSGGSITVGVTVTNAQGCSATASLGVLLATQGDNLDGWKNKAPLQWQSSTFNNGDHQYSEGNSIPIRLELMQMCPGASWCVVLRYDFKDANTSRHFYDFLASYNASEPTIMGQECVNFNCGGSPTTFPIPMDPTLSYQLPGNFTVFNGAITNVSTYSIVSGSTTEKQITISGTTASGGGAKDVLILFGSHLARENEWGVGNGASSFPGASAKILYQFCGDSSFGNFGVNPGGIVKQADLSITKSSAPNPLCAGNTLTYFLVVSNAGPNQATPVTVLDPLPAGTTLASVNMSQGTYSGTSSLNLALGAINAGSNATITISVNVNTNAASSLTNTATVSATSPGDPFLANNTATAITAVFPRTSATPLSDQFVCLGASANFSTIGFGGAPFSYQWFKNGTALAGATNSSFSISSVGPTDAGTYCVTVAGHCGGATNSVTNCATLSLNTQGSATPLVSVVKCPGENATFGTTPGGTGPFTFVWRKDGVNISGAADNTLTISNVTAADAGSYCVEVSGACGVTNTCATLIVRTNTDATPLADLTRCPGEAATFATTASGTGPFSYQWRKDGALLPGQTSASLVLPSVSASNAGSYCVEVTGTCNRITNCASLAVNTTTTADPLLSQTNCPGSKVMFSTTAHGTGPFGFQWFKDGAPLSGQTNGSLMLQPISATDAGTYSVQVTGSCSGATNSATLTVNQNVVIANGPASITNCPGASASFNVSASGTGLSFQWFKDASMLDGQTNSTLLCNPAGGLSDLDAGTYSVVVSGVCGNPVTNSATLAVNQNVVIATAPVSLTNCPGTSASFSVVAGGTGPFSYQWFKGASILPGQTQSSLTLANVSGTDAGIYNVIVNGVCGNAASNSATLTVNQSLAVVSVPASLTNCPGTTASFNVSAAGTGLSYQWFKGTSALADKTSSNLNLGAVSPADAGTYSVVVSGVCGNPLTNSATLTINTPVSADALISQTQCPGTTANFNTVAHGTGPFSYQWIKNGGVLPGQTNAVLTLANITTANSGLYAVQVNGACTSVTNFTTLTVNAVTLVEPLISQTACPGASASFNAVTHGTGPFTFLWRKDGKLVPGGTGSSLVIGNVSVLDAGTYAVTVTGSCTAVTNSATLTISGPTIASAMANQNVCFGQTATFSTTPQGSGPFTFVWKKNGNVLAGQTSNSLTLTRLKATDAATYTVEVAGQCNSITNSATLAVASDGLVSPATFANPNSITINDFSPATPYPATIEASCVPSALTGVTVTITNLSHTYASDVNILLVSPGGQAVMLMDDAGGATAINNATISFSDDAADLLSPTGTILSGVYKPTSYGPADNLPTPAPPGPYASALSTLNGSDPNGTWSLYVADDNYADTGLISGGWSLTLRWGDSQPYALLSSPTILPDGTFKATLQGQIGKSYVIEASTGLFNWTPILTNTLTASSWNFVDANRTNFNRRFYRAVTQP